MQLVGRSYDTGQAVRIEIDGDRITATSAWRRPEKASLPWIAPGLVDLQVNGHGGCEFTNADLTVGDVERISLAMDRDGVTSFLPTVTTQDEPVLAHSLRTIAQAVETNAAVRHRVVGIHLEGPYLSPEDGPRGAHPKAWCRPPDWDQFQRLQEAARGLVRVLTLSPEYPDCDKFIQRVARTGVLVAIGHTSANSGQIQAAVDAGAGLSTHLGNGAHARIRRHPNYIWDQLADDRLTASLILDGHHLPPSVVKCFLKVKTAERIVLISDLTGVGGMPPGRYEKKGFGDVEVLEDGRAVVAGQADYLAGACLPVSVGISNVMQFAGVDLAGAVDMASAHPARLIDAPVERIQARSIANLIQFELPDDGRPMKILATINAGRCVHGQPVGDEG